MIISLTGIIIVQLFWIKNAIEVKKAEYSKNVKEALENIIQKIERKQQIVFLSENIDRVIYTSSDGDSISTANHFYEYFLKDSITNKVNQKRQHINYKVTVNNDSNLISVISNKSKENNDFVFIGADGLTSTTNSVIVVSDTAKVVTNTYKIVKAKQFEKNLEDMVLEFETRFSSAVERIDFENLNNIIKA